MSGSPDDLAPLDDSSGAEKNIGRKPYTRPEIIHELELETRAGSPLAPVDSLDPLRPQD